MESFPGNGGSIEQSEPDDLLQLELLLQGGFSFKLNVRLDDPLLAQVLAAFSLTANDRASKIFKINIERDTSSIIFRASELVGVRTTPPVEFLPASVPERADSVVPSARHAIWLCFEDFLPKDAARRVIEEISSKGADFIESADRSERVFRYAGTHTTEFETSKIELERALYGRISEILDAFGLEFYAYEFNCEVSAYADGCYSMPAPSKHASTHGKRVLEFLYFVFGDDVTFKGGRTRVYDLATQGDVNKIGSIAVELPPLQNAILVFPSEFYFEITPVELASSEAGQPLFVLRGNLSVTP